MKFPVIIKIVVTISVLYLLYQLYQLYQKYNPNNADVYLTRKFLRDIADYDIDARPEKLLQDIQTNKLNENCIIVSQPESVDTLATYLKDISTNVNLLCMTHNTHGTDRSFTYHEILNHPHVSNVFSENWYDSSHVKVTQIPIGISYKDVYMNGMHNDLVSISQSMPSNSTKPLRVLCNAHKKTYPKPSSGYRDDRKIMYTMLKDSPWIDFCEDVHDFSEKNILNTWRKHKDYAFELSPSGNGLDCHRTYEAIILHTIPIVRKNTLDSIYIQHDLPVVIVDEWSDVTLENLQIWHEKFKDSFTDTTLAKMKSDYWKQTIQQISSRPK